MLTVNRRHSIHKQFQATRDRQICRAWRVERHDKTGRQHRSARWVLAITGLRKPTCTGRMIKKCSLAVIGKVSAPASRIQVNEYGPGPQHIAIEVDNVEGVCKELESEGLTFSTQIIKGSDLIQRFTVRCPNSGVMIEFIERNEEEGFSEKNVEDLFRQLEASDSY